MLKTTYPMGEATEKAIVEHLQTIFNKFLEENFSITSNVYFDILLNKLRTQECKFVLAHDFVTQFTSKCLTIVTEDFKRLHRRVVAFMLELCSTLASDEWGIMHVREYRILDKLFPFVDKHMEQLDPSMKRGFIHIIAAVSQHSIGLSYMRCARVWRYLIEFCSNEHTLYVVNDARALLYELLYKFSVKTGDEQIVVEILGGIFKPVMEHMYDEDGEDILINVDDPELQHKLSASWDLLRYIFEKTLESDVKMNIVPICRKHFNMSICIWKFTEMTKNVYFSQKIFATLTAYNFAELLSDKWEGEQLAENDFDKFGLNFYNMMKFCISRVECTNYLRVGEYYYNLWKKLGHRVPQKILVENELIGFENQLITFLLLPVLFILKSKEIEKEELFDTYLMKLFHISCEQTLRIGYTFRDILYDIECTSPQLVADLACKAIHGILGMQNMLAREQAIIVFQGMIYVLKEYILHTMSEVCGENAVGDMAQIKKEEEDGAKSSTKGRHRSAVEIPSVIHGLLVGLKTLISRYKLTWKESIETICVVNCVAVILEYPELQTTVVVQAFALLQLSIEHFLSPNMALLVNNLQGSGLVYLGPIIKKRFHDPSWEIRDSALELTASIANISHIKFPAFQRFLDEQEIFPIVFDMLKHDCEPYVRASALQCLCAMISINVIWEKCPKKLDIINYLFGSVYLESEGLVRLQVVRTIHNIYAEGKLPSCLNDVFYSALAHCVIKDLHWEVKIAALKVYKCEMARQLTNQGMIDGTFPSVTFSKENKKIVKLTEQEINVRIVKAFNKLSQRGCFGVILRCIEDDCDVEVIRIAVQIVQDLLQRLSKYNYMSVMDNVPTTPEPNNHLSSSKNSPIREGTSNHEIDGVAEEIVNHTNSEVDGDESDETRNEEEVENEKNTESMNDVIESILDANDINLLCFAYEKQMNLDKKQFELNDTFYKDFTHVTPKEFFSKMKNINNNNNSTRSINHLTEQCFLSMLDEIVDAITPADEATIVPDCY